MDFDQYQKKAHKFNVRTESITHVLLGLSGEVGELHEKYKRVFRGDVAGVERDDVTLELGDILWHVSEIAHASRIALSNVALCNIEKLEFRKRRGVIRGKGDYR